MYTKIITNLANIAKVKLLATAAAIFSCIEKPNLRHSSDREIYCVVFGPLAVLQKNWYFTFTP
jgi:hypothetical protein